MQLQPDALDRILAGIPLFSGLEPTCLARLVATSRMLDFDRGEQVFRKGDPPDGFFYVFDGKVKLFFVSERGNEKIVEILTKGMTFGEAVVFINKPYPVFAEALTSSRLLFVQRESLMQAMRENHEMALRLLSGLSRRMHGLVTAMEAVCVQTSRERVIGYLLARFDAGAGDSFELPATKAVVASMLNLTPETFSRILHGLEKEEILEIDKREIRVLLPERLREYSPC
jgi:CRP-like cAMP-binding protein